MIERHIPFAVPAGHADAFERFFAERYRPPATQMPGLISIGLLRAADDPTRYEMTFRWHDGDAATAWRTSLVHEGLQPELKSLASMGEIHVFDVIE